MRTEIKEGANLGMGVGAFLLIVALVIGALAGGSYWLRLWALPWALELERTAFVHSVQFVEARKAAAYASFAEWSGGNCTFGTTNPTCNMLAGRIKTELLQLESKHVPGDLRGFMN